jgi:phosphatidylglycerol:prolipoprotein diacylglycerol transferase
VLAYWTDTLDPFLVRFHGNFGIHWYGITYVLGFLAGAWLLYQYARAGKSLVGPDRIPDLMTWCILGVFLGGRLGHYFLYDDWRTFPSDPLLIFRVWDGGMASHGGMLGVALALAWFARAQRVPFLHLGDLITTAAGPGLFLVRIGNFINGELWGRPSLVPWAVIFPDSPRPLLPRHPSQLYEAGLEGLLLGAYLQLRMWRSEAAREQPGRLSGEFLLGYALMRMIGEQFREPDASLILGLSRGTFYSIFLVGFGLFLCLRPKRPLPLAR